MPSSETAQTRFLETLRRSRLLADEEIDPFVEQRSLATMDDSSIAREFLKAQLLTPFQAKYLLHGRWRGLVIGKYRIFEPVSAGGMGEVYLARHSDFDEPVAIKILRSELRDSARSVERFRLEAFAVMTLKHPNLLRGIEYDTIEQMRKQTHYLVTEFVPGPNLYELTIIRHQLPWQQACDLAQQAALGLHFAHENGFIHRDVKPGNLIISSSGIIKVVDFGLAQYKGQDQSFHFSMRKRRGTERYAAPEQSVSDHPIDPRADIYSLGCTLYFALCGRPPSDNSSDLYPSSKTAISRLTSHRDDLPEALLQIIKRMLRRKPDQRFDSCAEVAQELASFGKRLGVDVNYPALLRAREKSRRTEASWNTDAKIGGTTEEAESRPTSQSQRDDLLNAFASGPENASDTGQSQATQNPGLHRFAEIYRRHRQHVDRLYQRIESLEQAVRESRSAECELRTQLNAKEIEKQQVIAENREIIALMRQEASTTNQADLERETANYRQRISQLETALQTASEQLENLQTRFQEDQTRLARGHAREIDKLNSNLSSQREMFARQYSKRLRTAEYLNRLRGEVIKLQQQFQQAKHQQEQATADANNELEKRQRAELLVKDYTEHLNEVARRADALSAEVGTIFANLSNHQSDQSFFESYEKACQTETDQPLPGRESIDDLLANVAFLGEATSSDSDED